MKDGSPKTISHPHHQKRYWAILAGGIGLALVILFGLRGIQAARDLRGGANQPPAKLRDWMTIPYIAEAYRVPEETLFEVLEIPAEGNRHKTLAELNRAYFPGQRHHAGQTLEQFLARQRVEEMPAEEHQSTPPGGAP